MTLSTKLELLGQISERAREIERPGVDNEAEFVRAIYALGCRNDAANAWPKRRDALVTVLAEGVNWILARDRRPIRDLIRPAPRPHAPSCAFPEADCWCGAFGRKVQAWG